MTSQEQKQHSHVHPMVPVPEAILSVLKETARIAVAQAAASQASLRSEPLDLYDDDKGVSPTASQSRVRVLARDVVMPPPGYPPYRASVMDGYAISTKEYEGTKEQGPDRRPRRLFRVVRKVHAGDIVGGGEAPKVAAEEEQDEEATLLHLPAAYYVTTGAVVPDGCDCVVPLEVVAVLTTEQQQPETTRMIELMDSADVRPGRWIRAVGFDLPPDSVVASAGQALDSTAVGLLRQAGMATARVLPLVRVGVLSTGNELVDDPKWLRQAASSKGRIPDVNRPVLISLYSSWNNCEAVDLGIVRDSDDAAIRDAITSAIKDRKCQVVVSTGGISMGEMDRMEPVLRSLHARLHFGRLHMKPGKPTTFATLGSNDTLVFCLPGNPVSAAVCSHLLVRPCLDLLYRAPLALAKDDGRSASAEDQERRLVEDMPVLHPEVPVAIQNDVVLDAERPEYHRVQLRPTFVVGGASKQEAVAFEAHSTGVQQSSRLASMRDARALVLLPQATPGQRRIAKGSALRALLLDDVSGIFPRLRLGESQHMMRNKEQVEEKSDASEVPHASSDTPVACTRPPLAVEVVLVRCIKPTETDSDPPDLSELTRQVEQALGVGPASSPSSFRVVSSRSYAYAVDAFSPEAVWEEVAHGVAATTNAQVDVQVVLYEGPMMQQLRLASHLKTVLSKLAPALVMDARQGIASETATLGALFDAVVGVVDVPTQSSTPPVKPNSDAGEPNDVDSSGSTSSASCRLFLLLPVHGSTGALSSVRRQVRHAVKVAQQSG